VEIIWVKNARLPYGNQLFGWALFVIVECSIRELKLGGPADPWVIMGEKD
jgi:hypothetical protein